MSDNKLNEDVIESVKNDVFRQFKVKLTDDDPIFSLALLNRHVAEQISDNIIAAISVLPTQLDNKLQDRINEIGVIAQKMDDEVQKEAATLSDKIRADAEYIGNTALKQLHTAINDDIGEGLKRINAAANIVEEVSKDAGSTKYVIMTALACSLFSFIAGFAGVATWNIAYLDRANAKVANLERIMVKQYRAKDALLASLPKNQAEKASKIYDDFINNK